MSFPHLSFRAAGNAQKGSRKAPDITLDRSQYEETAKTRSNLLRRLWAVPWLRWLLIGGVFFVALVFWNMGTPVCTNRPELLVSSEPGYLRPYLHLPGYRALEAAQLKGYYTAVPIFFYQTYVTASDVNLLNLTRAYNPHSVIYLFTSLSEDVVLPADTVALLQAPPLEVHVVYIEHYLFPGTDAARFRDVYVHRSINPFFYERLCFERFFVMRDVAKLAGISRLFYMDADTALFTDLEPFTSYQDFDYVGLTTFTSYFAVYKLPALEDFCKYILDFYERPLKLIEEDIVRYGLLEQNKTSRLRPKELALHLSDMYLFHRFLHDPSIVIRSKLLLDDPKVFPAVKSIEDIHLLAKGDENVCQSVESFDSVVNWQPGANGRLVPVSNGVVLLGLHFQGTCKKLFPHVFRFLGFLQ